MNKFKIFFSWQSDLPSNRTKRLVEDCLEKAKKKTEKTEIIIDEATRERFGSPDITISILEKIKESDLFIADVSIVGKYVSPNEADEDEPEENFFSNPNVLLELGYAAGILGWERCICLANSDFGEFKKLPFDLNHRRITNISYKNTTRNKVIEEISGIITSTVEVYIDKPLSKQGFAMHRVGGYNFLTNDVEPIIIPYNPVIFDLYEKKNEQIIDEIKKIIETISNLHVSKTEDYPEEKLNSTEKERLNQVKLASESFEKLIKTIPVKIDAEAIKELLEKYVKVEVDNDFFDLGNLKQTSITLPYNDPEYVGSNEEIEKYKKICAMYSKLCDLQLRDIYIHTFDDIYIIPLSIKNISNMMDANISINIKVLQGEPIQPTAQVFNEDFASKDTSSVGFEGMVHDTGLVEEVFALPENSNIKHDHSKPVPPEMPMPFSMSQVSPFGYYREPDSTGEDYEYELQEYVEELYEGTTDEYHFEIGNIRPNETLWLDRVILAKPVDGKIEFSYSIKSNKTTGEISGLLSYEAR